ncbi:mechanosensitive ion channel family protein [Clostridium minihomine]|uniref:mechanosensitive ion channel family protein n=1 Tax=Clostridium minihomine TaxID=2045012 RepID=UPI000C78C52D|nr:mechanosensitive ion channel domain-containing protein [Clostridium minihomine]
MRELLLQWFIEIGLSDSTAGHMSTLSMIALVAVLCVVGNLLARKLLSQIVGRITKNKKYRWDDKIFANRLPHRLSHLISPLIIGFFADEFPIQRDLLNRCLSAYIIIVMLFIMDAVLSAVDDIYQEYEISKIRPIKGFLQVIKIVLLIIGGIILFATLSGQSPLVLLGGISALTAVFMLVFQNAILGFVAGIQLTSNDMVRIGDWIEMPKYDANGTVLEISLCTVKVQNFDNTITTIPANALTSDSFRNWRGMQESGGRRIMRSIHLDVNSICFCTPQMLEHFSQIESLREYLSECQTKSIFACSNQNPVPGEPFSENRLTNLGLFRMYITQYLQKHPGIHQNMPLMVRQLEPQPEGIALQIYAFANSIEWPKYESIQSEIFEHLLAIVPTFGLRVFQSPTGHDLNHSLLASPPHKENSQPCAPITAPEETS